MLGGWGGLLTLGWGALEWLYHRRWYSRCSMIAASPRVIGSWGAKRPSALGISRFSLAAIAMYWWAQGDRDAWSVNCVSRGVGFVG